MHEKAKQSPEQQDKQREYLERIPFVSELLRRIDDISQAIRQGGSGIEETKNLLSDIPCSLRGEIESTLKQHEEEYRLARIKATNRIITGMQQSERFVVEREVLSIDRGYARDVKQTVIDLLDKKDLLFLSRKAVPESEFYDMHLDKTGRDES